MTLKKNFSRLLIVGLLFLAHQTSAVNAPPSTLLRNDTFEVDLNDWSLVSGDSLTRVNTNAANGSWSAEINAEDIGGGDYRCYISTDYINCAAETAYYISVWAYKTVVLGPWAHIGVSWFNETAGLGFVNLGDYRSNTGWFEMTETATSPATTTKLRLAIFFVDGPGGSDFTMNVDDVRLSDVAFPEVPRTMPILILFLAVLTILLIGFHYRKRKC